ncbi:hypothetical protein HK096_009027, partial [Nowakowskiella sp. JEL0078]
SFLKTPSKKVRNQDVAAASHRSQLWRSSLRRALEKGFNPSGTEYSEIECREMVGLFLLIFQEDAAIFRPGSIAIRFTVDDSSFCFVNCHLAAHQSHIAARNKDAADIMNNSDFRDSMITNRLPEYMFINGGDGSQILDHEKVFFFGDLNYRIELPRDTVLSLIKRKEWEGLMKHDQLLNQKRTNKNFALKELHEGNLEFPPTFKFDVGSADYDSSEKKRTPAWCDRILFCGSQTVQTFYESYKCNESDHKPIGAEFKTQVKRVDTARRNEILKVEVEPSWDP